MARMLGRQARLRGCPVCRTAPGPDCADASRTRRQQRAHEREETRAEILAGYECPVIDLPVDLLDESDADRFAEKFAESRRTH